MSAKYAANSALLLVLMATGCQTAPVERDVVAGSATLVRSTGEVAGTAALLAVPAGRLRIEINLSGMKPGRAQAVHLHAVGACQGPAFTTAGPHLNPAGRAHGLENPGGSHLGDLPNIVAGPDGSARLSVLLPDSGTSLLEQIFDRDGTAIVLHADADDLRTDPTGNSGARVACGTLLPMQ